MKPYALSPFLLLQSSIFNLTSRYKVHRARSLVFIFTVILFTLPVFSKKSVIPDDPYLLVKQIPSFYAMFNQKGLNAYSADATVSGPMFNRLEEMASEKKLDRPEFVEYYIREKGFKFKLKNISYPPFFRQVVDEMFTPMQAFDRVVSIMESKREFKWFKDFKSNTRVKSKWIQYGNKAHIQLDFSPKKGEYFEKRTTTLGPVTKVTKTHHMRFIIQPEKNLIKVLKIDVQEEVNNKKSKITNKFTFKYKKIKSHLMPSELIIEKNKIKEIKFKAVYAPVQGFTVFSEKLFGYRKPDGSHANIRIVYDNYKFNKQVDLSRLEEAKLTLDVEQEAKAEKEFARAKQAIMNGNTKAAKKILKGILTKYPKTTYAEQARTLLHGLPD
jgi:hypothetical protein